MSPTRPPGSRCANTATEAACGYIRKPSHYMVRLASHRGLPAVIAPFGIQLTYIHTQLKNTTQHNHHTDFACNDVFCWKVFCTCSSETAVCDCVCVCLHLHSRDLRLKRHTIYKRTYTRRINGIYVSCAPRTDENKAVSPGICINPCELSGQCIAFCCGASGSQVGLCLVSDRRPHHQAREIKMMNSGHPTSPGLALVGTAEHTFGISAIKVVHICAFVQHYIYISTIYARWCGLRQTTWRYFITFDR